ncbi:MAG: DNA sulfur modification protein DndD [Telluria sp.]|nr:DNA sulfur modification protein DndD [Telluria sp.]
MAKITFLDISIENLGPFRERQTLGLNVLPDKPVILIKALNGSGKTTLLTALQIGLYGYKGANLSRRSEYDQLISSLQRSDAVGNTVIEVNLIVDRAGVRKPVTLRREWLKRSSALVEKLSVSSFGLDDPEFTEGWEEFINGILPAELVQLFLFDGEKIEALANPERLPDLLRRATEVFLGLGGIDALENDLKAVERRANLRSKDGSDELNETRDEAEKYEQQRDAFNERITLLSQKQAELNNTLDQAKIELERYTAKARRSGLTAFEQAAQLKANVETATKRRKEARTSLVEAIEDPLLPLAWLGSFWDSYKSQWEHDQQAVHAALLAAEFKKRDQRLLKSMALPPRSFEALKQALKDDLAKFKSSFQRKPILVSGGDPEDVQLKLDEARNLVKKQATACEKAVGLLSKAEQSVGQIPAEEQLANVFSLLQQYSKAVSSAEIQLHDLTHDLAETRSQLAHTEMRLNSAKQRLRTEFKDEALEQHGLEAAARAKRALGLFRERLLASKAHWLSEMITTEFRELLRKKKMISRVVVDPDTYAVSIVGTAGHVLPMDRLSAGERQILAISVLSALIRERKGRFPVVVDTPLARLDHKHRESLINNFFARVSHQVLVLSTDEEVHGQAYTSLLPFMAAEHRLDYDEHLHRTAVVSVGGA